MTIPVTVAELDAMRSELDVLRGNEVRVQELESIEGQIAALEGKGYAVVKLPEGVVDEFGDRLWVMDDAHHLRSGKVRIAGWSDGPRLTLTSVSFPIRLAAVDSLVGALLAAARFAEQVQP